MKNQTPFIIFAALICVLTLIASTNSMKNEDDAIKIGYIRYAKVFTAVFDKKVLAERLKAVEGDIKSEEFAHVKALNYLNRLRSPKGSEQKNKRPSPPPATSEQRILNENTVHETKVNNLNRKKQSIIAAYNSQIHKKITTQVIDLGNKNKFTFILNSGQLSNVPIVLYVSSEIQDITDDLIAETQRNPK